MQLKHYASGSSGPDAMIKGRVSLDAGSVASQRVLEVTFTFPEVLLAQSCGVSASPTAALTAGIGYGGARCVADGILGITYLNITTAAVDPAAVSWDVVVVLG